MTPTDFSQIDEPKRRRLIFDPTINAGHVLTFASLAFALFIGWSALDKRVVILEEAKFYQVRRDEAQDQAIGDKFSEIRDRLKDVQGSVDELRRDRMQSGNKP